MLIKEIKKAGKNEYKLILKDKEIILYEDLLIKYNILLKKEISEDLLKEVEKENTYYEAYNKALSYLEIKMRLEKEIEEYLKNKYDQKIINKVISKLKKEDYLNVSKYIIAYINDKINFANDGPYKIKRDLINKGIDESLINIESIDQELITSKLERLITKYSNINKNNSKNIIKSKVMSHFSLLGYDKELINDVFDNLNITGDNTKIKKDYDKLYEKYSKKVSGYKLDVLLKQKLYQKGYSIDEINNL